MTDNHDYKAALKEHAEVMKITREKYPDDSDCMKYLAAADAAMRIVNTLKSGEVSEEAIKNGALEYEVRGNLIACTQRVFKAIVEQIIEEIEDDR